MSIRVHESTRKRLGDFAAHDETLENAIGRLLNFWEENKR
jgi:hypothetical protein